LKLGFLIDTSGSVSDESLSRAFAELDALGHLVAEITIIEADCTVQNVYKYEKGKTKSVSGRGGTAYQPAIDEAIKRKLNGIIYFGDGDTCGETLQQPKVPFLWLMVNEHCTPPATWGKVAHITEK
jgi:predicted metal-dependent peptidase